ncbi:MAG: hypothetical protein NTY32_10365, partial [Bacteroidia bacterium]|nr:hypothetical protein [Bacteroidia bacterium]
FMNRQSGVKNHTFASVIEPHGLYDLSREVTSGYQSVVSAIELIQEDEAFTVLKMETRTGKTYLFVKVNSNFNATNAHSLVLNGKEITFFGNALFTEYKD